MHASFGGETKGRSLLARHRHRQEDDIKTTEIGWKGDWTDLAPDKGKWWAFVNMVMNSQVP